MHDHPLAYFITVRTYGTWLHGDDRGSVDRRHNRYYSPLAAPDAKRARDASHRMNDEPFVMDVAMRLCVEQTMREVCDYRGWKCWALNVRTNHVHVVVTSPEKPERVMNDLKSRATRHLADRGFITRGQSVWTRHGSTEYLWTERDIDECCRYVLECQ